MDLLIPLSIILVALIILYIFQNKKKKEVSTNFWVWGYATSNSGD